jgi:choline-sulfatase
MHRGSGSDRRDPAEGGLTRRQFVRAGGAAVAAGIVLPQLAACADPGAQSGSAPASKRPNLLVIVTDQERYPRHWPEGWAEKNLPNRQRLAKNGLTFTRAYCASAMCSPSRASLLTGVYPAQHGVTEVLEYGTDNAGQSTLQPMRKNIANLLASAGYDVQYRGKWHISKDPTGLLGVQSPRDLAQYGFEGWLPPESGLDEEAIYFGGGDTDYDALYAEQAAEFLKSADPESSKPFALIVAFANPHDVMGYPKTWNQASASDIEPYKGSANYVGVAPGCFNQGISLPDTLTEVLRRNFKPAAQYESTEMWSAGLEPIRAPEEMLEYVNFYAYLHRLSDENLGTVLDALDANAGLPDSTIVIGMSDHGEMGLAHGGMREKAYNAYEETVHVPLVVSNPRLFPDSVRTDALASLVDIMPTLAALAGASVPSDWGLKGRDLSPVIQAAIEDPGKPAGPVQDSILFTTDETLGDKIVKQPSHIRCLIQDRWKLAMYFDPAGAVDPVYELYDLKNDPSELRNMAAPDGPHYDSAMVATMKAKLDQKMAETGTTPA